VPYQKVRQMMFVPVRPPPLLLCVFLFSLSASFSVTSPYSTVRLRRWWLPTKGIVVSTFCLGFF